MTIRWLSTAREHLLVFCILAFMLLNATVVSLATHHAIMADINAVLFVVVVLSAGIASISRPHLETNGTMRPRA